MIKGTINLWARSLGVDWRTLEKRLTDGGVRLREDGEYTAKQVFNSLLKQSMLPKDRLAIAQAIKVERENSEAERETVRLAEVEKLLTELVTLPVRQWIIDQPQRLDTRCNPDHPEVARLALKQDGDDLLKILRDKLV